MLAVKDKTKRTEKKKSSLGDHQFKSVTMQKNDEIIFTLSGLNETRANKQIYFAFSVLVYILTLFMNLTLIVTIALQKFLHEPMYIFLCNMCVNGICGASSFYPKILFDFFLDTQLIFYNACVTQTFIIYVYIFFEFTNLTVMAYDRYVAICKPLEYHSIMTPGKVGKLLIISWLLPLCEANIGLVLTLRLPLCGSRIDKPYCFNWDVVKLSCIETTVNNVYGYFLIFLHMCEALLIVLSYMHIIKASVRSRAEYNKFMETCLPHLVTLTNFTFLIIFDVMYARYGSSKSHQILRNMLSIEYLVVPPILNPLIYGLKLKQIRRSVWRLVNRKISALK